MKIYFTKTSEYLRDGKVMEFNNLDNAITTLIEDCKEDQRHGGTVELIVYCDSDTKNYGCDYTIEYYDDWRE